jgi:uncharacterized delta-60 repeat protein
MAARLLQNGRLDPSFGRRGIVTVAIGDTALGFSVAVQPDGRIILAGNAYAPRLVAATVRLLPNGVLDPTYGRRGIAKLPVALGINAMTLQPDGDILLGGVGASAIRLLPNGSPDPTFGRAGIATVALGDTGGAANGITLAPGRKIVLAGAAQFLGRITLTVIRLNG